MMPISARVVDPVARRGAAPWLILLTGILLISGAVFPWFSDISITAPVLGIIRHHDAAIGIGFATLGVACMRFLWPAMPRIVFVVVLVAGVAGMWVGFRQVQITSGINEATQESAGEFAIGVGVYLLLAAGFLGLWATAVAFREQSVAPPDLSGAWRSDWRDRVLALVAVGIGIFLTTTAASNSAETQKHVDAILSQSEDEPAPVPDVNPEYQECVNDVAYAVDQIAAGNATLQNVAYEYGIQDPRYQITLQAYSRYAGLAIQIGLEDAAIQVYDEIVEPGCADHYGGP